MKQKTIELLKQQGYEPIFAAIIKSKQDLKQLQYTRGEIKETLLDFFGIDNKIISFINSLV